MAKFSSTAVRSNASHPVRTTAIKTWTYEGGAGYERDTKSELFLLAVSNFVREDTFYEAAATRDHRFEDLVSQMTEQDPEWVRKLILWLRNEAQMRSASLVAAAEYVNAGGKNGRQLVASVLRRADEPGEMLAYWMQRHGRRLPKPVKRGVADAVLRLYNERSALKYDGQSKVWRFGDVIELVHPSPKDGGQSALFKYLIDARHDRDVEAPVTIAKAKAVARSLEAGERVTAQEIKAAGVSWERQSSNTKMDAAAWERQIPSMGYMALLRNLRNFDQARIGDEAVRHVAAKLTDAAEVARSRQFPMRFLAAFKAVESERWKPALATAVDLSMQNVPSLPGRTLVLVDVSGSMLSRLSARSQLERWEAAGLFGAALATRAESADLYAYSSVHRGNNWRGLRAAANYDRKERIAFGKGASVFTVLSRIRRSRCFNGGTETWQTVSDTFKRHDRVVILTDEQAFGGARGTDPGPSVVPLIYTWNLAGYVPAHNRSGDFGRYTFGGLTDKMFAVIPMLEAAKDGAWPWENS